MSEEAVVRCCAPTLAGLKTGSLFTCPCEDRQAVTDAIRRFNARLRCKGLQALALRFSHRRALIYVYRPHRLQADFSAGQASRLLTELGYQPESCRRCVGRLIRKLRSGGEFPHEIGLFLGYPPEDVQGFMEHHAAGSKCTGCWRVYGDPEAAQKRFAQYEKCTRIYRAQWKKGTAIERLTVADGYTIKKKG